MAEVAQLGTVYQPNLGGYIPVQQRGPKLWEQALAGFVGNMAGQAGGAVIDRATAPDLSSEATRLGMDPEITQGHGLSRGVNAAELRNLSDAGVNKDSQATQAGHYAEEEKLGRGKFLLDVGNSKDARDIADRNYEMTQKHLDFAKEQFTQAKTEQDREYWRQVYKDAAATINTRSDNSRADAVAKADIGLKDSMSKAYEASVPVKDATATLTTTKSTAEQEKIDRRKALLNGSNPFSK